MAQVSAQYHAKAEVLARDFAPFGKGTVSATDDFDHVPITGEKPVRILISDILKDRRAVGKELDAAKPTVGTGV
jgi:hypothetical protein